MKTFESSLESSLDNQELLPENGLKPNPETNKNFNSTKEQINKDTEEQRSIIKNNTTPSSESLMINIAETESDTQQPTTVVDRYLVNHLTNKTIQDTQAKLKPIEKSFSKVINQPIIDKSSEILDQTIFRSSGIMGGSVLAFVGSLLYLLFVNYTGINYNFELFFVFLISGFVLGITIELVFKLIKKMI